MIIYSKAFEKKYCCFSLQTPEVTPAAELDLKWEKPDEEALIKYMCEEKGFAEDRIRNGCKKLTKARYPVKKDLYLPEK